MRPGRAARSRGGLRTARDPRTRLLLPSVCQEAFPEAFSFELTVAPWDIRAEETEAQSAKMPSAPLGWAVSTWRRWGLRTLPEEACPTQAVLSQGGALGNSRDTPGQGLR